MAYSGLASFISDLEKHSELLRVTSFADPLLEITEITDRISKAGGKALLFENNGTDFPLLINAFGSPTRMAMALGSKNLDEPGAEILTLFNTLSGLSASLFGKISSLPEIARVTRLLPSRSRSKGKCQQVVMKEPDLSVFPVLKCWPHDGGRFITLPVVHTINPVNGKTNAGMYRMQILDSRTTAMHWQRHKTGASHFEEWKRTGRLMPVSVTLGGDPVYTYAATAPLPENIDEYILAGFLRKKRVVLVKCITNDLYVPSDADIVIEGYIDPSEEPVWEGPFGDHTGFYSLADWYPKFHVTCITHSRNAVYPATIVGVPPMEDAWLTNATEKIFLAPLKLALLPEIEDFHMPDAGTAHNLVIVKIRKSYPGQGRKVINSLLGAGQMMFTKYMVVVSGEVDIRNYSILAENIFSNTAIKNDLQFTSGPLDVLDHSSDTFSFGGKLGIDATIKMPEEMAGNYNSLIKNHSDAHLPDSPADALTNAGFKVSQIAGLPVFAVATDHSGESNEMGRLKLFLSEMAPKLKNGMLVLAVDINVDLMRTGIVAWQVLGNSDPLRDISLYGDSIIFIDGTMKIFGKAHFPRRWPNVVSSSEVTIKKVNEIWDSFGIGPLIKSPSASIAGLNYSEGDEVKPLS